jgi:hypothetical protein
VASHFLSSGAVMFTASSKSLRTFSRSRLAIPPPMRETA